MAKRDDQPEDMPRKQSAAVILLCDQLLRTLVNILILLDTNLPQTHTLEYGRWRIKPSEQMETTTCDALHHMQSPRKVFASKEQGRQIAGRTRAIATENIVSLKGNI